MRRTPRPRFRKHTGHAAHDSQGDCNELGSHRRELEAVQGQREGTLGKLTDDHIDVIAGKRDQLTGRIQETYGIGKDVAEKQVAEWQGQLKGNEKQ
jgi:uncharacterized protein YjbJ (UPF0337 family)